MITTEMKAKRGKCLALVAVLAMVVCAVAIAMPAGETEGALPEATGNVITLTDDVTITSGDVADITGKTIECGEHKIYSLKKRPVQGLMCCFRLKTFRACASDTN